MRSRSSRGSRASLTHAAPPPVPVRRRCRSPRRRSRRRGGAARTRASPGCGRPTRRAGGRWRSPRRSALTRSGSSSVPLAEARQRLRGERLVELDHLDVVPADARARERAVRPPRPGAMPKTSGSTPCAPRPAIRASGSRPSAAPAASSPMQQRAGAVVERRRVAGRDRAVLRERRLELRQLLERRVGAHVLVALELGAGHRHDPVVVEAGVPGGGGEPVAAQRELVLRLAADAVDAGQLLRARAERDRPLAPASRGLTIRQPSVVECSVCVAGRERRARA